MTEPQALGATQEDWDHWDLVLGCGRDLLPVVPDPKATPAPDSKVKAFGKIPSRYDAEGNAVGIAKWTEREITPEAIAHWRKDARLGMCVRSSAVRAIDCDVDDAEMACAILDTINAHAPKLPMRQREDSQKFLLAFRAPGPLHKRIISTKHGRIELLGDGQQFVVAGTHPKGARYEWPDGRPNELPELTLTQVDALWSALEAKFGLPDTRPKAAEQSITRDTTKSQSAPLNLQAFTREVYDDLQSALAWPPLVAAAADNTTWSEIGYALLCLNEIGWDEWRKFSRSAPNYTPGAPEEWWEAHRHQQPRSDYRHVFTMAKRLGWRTLVEADAFHDTTEPVGEPPAELVVDDTPKAHYLCTDLRNAQRLHAAYGSTHLIVVGGVFYAWMGTHWRRDDAEAARCASRLSTIVQGEAQNWREQFKALLAGADDTIKKAHTNMVTSSRPDQSAGRAALKNDKLGTKLLKALKTAEALEAWAKRCEMAGTIDAALRLLRTSLSTESVVLDSDRNLVNCLSGTIDARTGEIRAHDPKDYITRCAPVEFKPDARADRFELFVSEIMGGDEARVEFLRRWFGYSITGDIREQKVLLHIGPGANGKTTLVDAIKDVFGDYAHTGAPGLLTVSAGDRHPTEIADLAGRRLVTVHETDDGAVLREGLLKQATGGDRLTGRFLFKDFFEFAPTHKLQLLTNHKPVVRGQDHAIWRRLLLVTYGISFGSAEEIAIGKAQSPKDVALPLKLLKEREGIFAWVMRGAREWYELGLAPPASVIEASEAYRAEQDRVAEFVGDRCILGPNEWTEFGGPSGIYPHYVRWCKENGYHPLGNRGFINELQRVVPGYQRVEQMTRVDGIRKTVRGCKGVRVNPDEDGGGMFVSESNNEDLL
jgi:putative DNA primase/helicase